MSELQTRIQELTDASNHPRKRLEHYLSQGKQVVGCFPVYAPEVLVHASGLIPMGLWGAQTQIKLAKQYLPPFACPIMQSTLELGLRGSYRGLSAVVIPTLCDTFRCVSQDWRHGVKEIPMIPITYPQNRKIPAAEDFLISEYEAVLAKLSMVTGHSPSEDSLEASLEIYNQHAAAVQDFARAANDHLDLITPRVRHAILKSAHFYEKQEHTALLREITKELDALPAFLWRGKRMILSGITAEPEELLDILYENQLAVTGDDLAQESRLYRTPIPEGGGSPLRRLARQWMNRQACSLAHEDDRKRGEFLVQLCRKEQAQGVVYCQMKFCDPEEYDYPVCKKALAAAGIPVLMVEIDQQNTSYEQIRTRIQTFGEMLGSVCS